MEEYRYESNEGLCCETGVRRYRLVILTTNAAMKNCSCPIIVATLAVPSAHFSMGLTGFEGTHGDEPY